jgi:hypothetical protein
MNSDDSTGSSRTVIREESLNRFLQSNMSMLLSGGRSRLFHFVLRKICQRGNSFPTQQLFGNTLQLWYSRVDSISFHFLFVV